MCCCPRGSACESRIGRDELMATQLAAEPKLLPETPDSAPCYGWRYRRHEKPDGIVELEEVPLTLEDVLHPLENDVIPEQPFHEQERGYLSGVFRTRLSRLTGGLVLSDCLVDWGVPGIRN